MNGKLGLKLSYFPQKRYEEISPGILWNFLHETISLSICLSLCRPPPPLLQWKAAIALGIDNYVLLVIMMTVASTTFAAPATTTAITVATTANAAAPATDPATIIVAVTTIVTTAAVSTSSSL